MTIEHLRGIVPVIRCPKNPGHSNLTPFPFPPGPSFPDFKRINDSHGHDAGAAALRSVSDALRQGLREGDLLARWGGEEFIAMVESDHASACAERLRQVIRNCTVTFGDADLRLTVLIGLAHAAAGSALEAGIADADHALYRATQAGRDRVVETEQAEEIG